MTIVATNFMQMTWIFFVWVFYALIEPSNLVFLNIKFYIYVGLTEREFMNADCIGTLEIMNLPIGRTDTRVSN